MLIAAALLLAQAHAQNAALPDATGEWRLSAIQTPQGRFGPAPEVRVPTLSVTGSALGGDAGCNRYSGAFGADGRVGPLISTLRACPGERDIEGPYLRMLEGSRVNHVQGDRLTLGRGNVTLEFVRVGGAGQTPAAPGDLLGEWHLLTVDGASASGRFLEPVRLELARGEREGSLELRGSDGCNTFFGAGEYDAASGTLRAPALGSTRRACPVPANPPELLRTLAEARLERSGDELQLRGDSRTWVFVRR